MLFSKTMAAAAAAMMVVGSAAAMAKEKTPQKPRTAESIQCSKDADAKNIHGKDRKKFMSACKKEHKPKPEEKKS